MKIEKIILNIVLSILNGLTFFIHPKQNRITFISMTADHLAGDFYQIDQALKKEGCYDIHYDLFQIHKTIKGYFLYFINLCHQLIQMKQSKLIILNDNNYIVSQFKPKETKVLQIWHACGAIKKFGNQIERSYPIQGYDAVLCSAPYWKEVYAQAFGVNSSQVYVTGLPRIDELLDPQRQRTQKEEFYAKYPMIKEKKCILYAPTFRGNMVKGFQVASFDMGKVLDALGDEYCILYKFHPLLPDIQINHQRAIDCHDEDLYALMHVSDVLISDYSSVILDYSLLNKPMIAYIDDVEEYDQTVGFNLDYQKEFPGPVCFKEDELMDALKDIHTNPDISRFQQKYIIHKDGQNTKRVIEQIHILMRG